MVSAVGLSVSTNFLAGDERGLPGGMLGSSVRLIAELVEIASAIGVALDNRGALSDAEAETLAAETEDATQYWRERIVWLTLYEAARCSILTSSAFRSKASCHSMAMGTCTCVWTIGPMRRDPASPRHRR